MKVIQLTAENVKRLKAIDITPADDMVIITGKNGQGKTSVLDSIWLAVGGADAGKAVVKPIREGANSAKARVDLGDLIVTRTWTKKGSYLRVENAEGAEYRSPQVLLDKLVGKLSFDPLAFAQMDDRKRREVLLALVDLGINLEAWTAERKEVYDDRTAVNRTMVHLNAQVEGVGQIPKDTPDEEVSPASVLKEQAQAQAVKEANDAERRRYQSIRQALEDLKKANADREGEISYYEGILEDLRKKQAEDKASYEANVDRAYVLKQQIDALEDPDLSIFEAKLEEVEATNANVRRKKQKAKLTAELTATKNKAGRLTERLQELDTQKAVAFAAAKFPIAGLGIEEEGITYNEIPFSQCSDAERLRVSLAIAMALNPQIRVLRITNGSLLDSDNLAIIREMIKANDFQLWIERVSDDGKVGVLIEDGEVVSQA